MFECLCLLLSPCQGGICDINSVAADAAPEKDDRELNDIYVI